MLKFRDIRQSFDFAAIQHESGNLTVSAEFLETVKKDVETILEIVYKEIHQENEAKQVELCNEYLDEQEDKKKL